jgi:hypothetical protein
MKRFLRLVVFVAVLVLLSACADGPKATPTLTLAPSATETSRPSETPAPTDTSSPTATVTATKTPSEIPTATATPSETPRPSFASFSVDYMQLSGYGMLISFKVPGIKDNYRLKVNKTEFKCGLNGNLPDRILCSGQQFRQGENVVLTFMPLTDDTVIFTTNLKIALAKTATPDPRTMLAPGGACPASSTNKVRCETEYRKDGKGGCCIVTTCFDSNGKCGSIDTCPQGSEHNGICQGTPPPLPK